MSKNYEYPAWYKAPEDPALKAVYVEKAAAFLLEEHTRVQKEQFTRADNQIALAKLRAENAEALGKLRNENAEALRKFHLESEDKQFSGMVDALRTAAIGAIDRSRDTAKYVQTASVAAAGLYTGLLGFVFGIADNAEDLPVRGVIPTVFFAFAVAFSTWYLSYLPDRASGAATSQPSSLPRLNTARNYNQLIDWVTELVGARAWALRAATLFLLLAVGFLPVAFIDPPVATAAADTGSTSAPEVIWPTPPPIAQEEVAVELYRRQLDAFEKSLKPAASAPNLGWDVMWGGIAIVLAIVALAFAKFRGFKLKQDDHDAGPNGGGFNFVLTGGPFRL